jgi:hypothetical protein
MSDAAGDVERLSADDLAAHRHFAEAARQTQVAFSMWMQHLGPKYLLGPTRRLREDGVIEVAGDPAPPGGTP